MRDLPSGTVTFLFTDVEGSTRLLHELGAEEYATALAEHRRLIREACARYDGVEVDTQGDAFFFAFPTAPGALAAAEEMTEALSSDVIRVRIGLHTGTPLLTDEGYVGPDVHFAARVAASSHGGQVVCSKATADLVEFDLLDLGEHRLKDIEGAVSLYQLGEGSFPPLKTISNTNLPRPASSFVGREAELAAVLSRIEAGARLVTLTGPGGTGKTRLALEAASSLVPAYKAGVFWVGLASLSDAALVVETISQTLGAKDGLAEHIAERELLLLLDNLEQVIEAAPALGELLSVCPNLTLLVTSRELLRVQGEVEYPVPPLAEPEAVALFCERAQLEPSEEIAELCARLDSLPLAVELAAARTKALSPAQILERLAGRLDLLKGGRDADPRQQTLRATIEWSYDLLTEEEQRLFARLSVFAGGCTLEAAEQVCDADLDTLQSLVEKSLLRFTNERYWMLETIREYAGTTLEDSGEADEERRRHSCFFRALALEAQSSSTGLAKQEWYDRLEHEYANFRLVLERARTDRDDLRFEIPGLLWRFWAGRDHIAEGQRWLEYALAEQRDESTSTREALLAGALWMAYERGDYGTARERGEERLLVARQSGDSLAEARSLTMLGAVAQETGDIEHAIALSEQAVAITLERDEASAAYWMMVHNLGVVWERAGDAVRAKEAFQKALTAARAAGDIEQVAMNHHSWAGAALLDQSYDEARAHLVDALGLWVEHGVAQNSLDAALVMVAVILASDRRPDRAVVMLGAVEHLDEDAGRVLAPQHKQRFDDVRALVGQQLDTREFERLWAEGRSMSLDEAVAYALASID